MFNDAISSTPSSVAFFDEQGEANSVQQLDGNFADHDNYLHFGGANGGFTVMMDSDICNTAVDTKPQDDPQVESGMAVGGKELEDSPVEYELDIKPALEDALAKGSSEEKDDGLFTRRDLHDDSSSASLRVRSISNGPQGIARVPSLNADKDVKARLREVFAKAKSVGPDRKLSSGIYVQACAGDTDCQVSIICGNYSLLFCIYYVNAHPLYLLDSMISRRHVIRSLNLFRMVASKRDCLLFGIQMMIAQLFNLTRRIGVIQP